MVTNQNYKRQGTITLSHYRYLGKNQDATNRNCSNRILLAIPMNLTDL
uniref:Uncharacterized protein n=1 Tax=Rhizophora mucronata TaxID=61149 RepID=A0A2P2K387_RHIMU